MKTIGLVVLAIAIHATNGLMIDLERGETRCLGLNLRKHALAVQKFEAKESADPNLPLHVTITRADGTQVYKSERGARGSVAFTADVHSMHNLCFWNQHDQRHRIWFEYSSGLAAKDYHEVATKKHLEPLEGELRRLEAQTEDVFASILSQRKREEQMRQTTEETNTEVMMYSGFSILVLAIVATWQVCNLQSFFHQIKIL